MKGDFDLEKISVRPSVYLYARKMESRLKQKDAKKGYDGWHDGKLLYYLAKIADCIRTIHEIIKIEHMPNRSIYTAIKKCIDLRNYAMMLADNLRDELIKRGIKGK